MRRIAPLLILAAVASCTSGPSRAPEPRSATSEQTARRVVLISLDGLAAARNERFLAEHAYRDPDGIAALSRFGMSVSRAIPANPTLTAVSHSTIATGAFPSQTGIVSNFFHEPGAALLKGISGFDAPWHAEALWTAFRRQGKRVGVLTFPGCDATTPARTADFGMTYPARSFTGARDDTLAAASFATYTGALPPTVTSASPPRLATVTVSLRGDGVPEHAEFQLVAIDSIDDGIVAYDTLLVDNDGDLADGVLATVHTGEWFPLAFTAPAADGGTRTIGAWCLLRRLPADLTGVDLYVGSFNATEAYPREFREALDATAGFWPGPGDDRALEHGIDGDGGLTPAQYLDQVRRFSHYFDTCLRTAVAREPFDLLMGYQPIVDEVQHILTITDRRQRDYSAGLAQTAAATIDETYRIADHAVGEAARALDLSADALVIVSDHGIAPIWELVNVNEVLHHAGLLAEEKASGRTRATADSAAYAFASGAIAHVVVNVAGREPGGTVPPAELDETVRRAARALTAVELDGEPAVEAMFTRDQLANVGLDNPASGDLVVFLRPGFAFGSRLGGPLHEPSPYFGQHGYLNTHPEMAAVWMARGRGVRPAHAEQRSLADVAGFVAALAGIDPPAQARPWRP